MYFTNGEADHLISVLMRDSTSFICLKERGFDFEQCSGSPTLLSVGILQVTYCIQASEYFSGGIL
jgi:hypothetical protein